VPDVLKRVAYAGAVLHCLSWAINADYEQPDPLHTILILAGAACLALIVRGDEHAGWAALGYALVTGLAFHLTFNPPVGFVDVHDATDEALRTLARGGNPYTHQFLQTRPIGSPFPYLPGELAFYALWKLAFGSIFLADRISAICILVVLAAMAPLVGRPIAALATALYGLSPMAVLRAADGSNDTALALLVYVGIVLLALALRSELATRLARAVRPKRKTSTGSIFGICSLQFHPRPPNSLIRRFSSSRRPRCSQRCSRWSDFQSRAWAELCSRGARCCWSR
jgi:hypothetical protein